MKLNAREASRFIQQPDNSYRAALIYGQDQVEVSSRKTRLARLLLGKESESDLRATRLNANDVRKDPASLLDALKAKGFFSGPQVVTVEDATDSHHDASASALSEINPDDAFLIVTAGTLPARSKIRKLFETARHAAAAPCYADQITHDDIRAMCSETPASKDAIDVLREIALSSGTGALRELLERLELYHLDDKQEITPEDIALCAPGPGDGDIDGLIDAVLTGRSDQLNGLLNRIESQGESPVSIARTLTWRLRQLHQVRMISGSPEAAISGLKPPVFGQRKDLLIRAANMWPLRNLEGALQIALELDNSLRGSTGLSGFALVERCLLKLSLTAARNRR